nr:hypothetical protein [Tanacetum cinerariifolium]
MAKVKSINDEVRVQALIDGKMVTIKDSSIRRILRLDDEEGDSCLDNDDIFTGFSRVITPLFKSLLVQAAEKVGEAQDDVSIPSEPSTSKPHKKHKLKKQQPIKPMVPSPKSSPEHTIPSPSNAPIPAIDEDSLTLQELMDLCIRLSNKLEDIVDQLEEENMALKEKSFNTTQVDTAAPVENIEKSFKLGRMITYMDEDVEVDLEQAQAKAYNLDLQHAKKVLSMQDTDEAKPVEVEEVLEVVKAAKLITEVVTTAQPTATAGQIPKPSAPKSKRGVIIQDPEETAASVIVHSEIDMNEAFARQLEAELNANINWNDVIEQVKRREKQDNAVISDDDDVFTEATPLASKVPVVDYQIHHENNKPYYKIIRADGTHKIMFEKPNVEANVWKEKKGKYGLAKKYPLTHFTLQQMLDNVRLEVEEE